MGPITLTLVGILGALLVIVLMQLFKKPAASAAQPYARDGRSGQSESVTDARAGDVHLHLRRGRQHDRPGFHGRPLHLVRSRRPALVRAERPVPRAPRGDARRTGDEVTVSVHNDPRKLTLEDLGLSEDDLAQMDERQNTADSFEFDGKTWLYRLSREAQAPAQTTSRSRRDSITGSFRSRAARAAGHSQGRRASRLP